ncbi:MAG: gliding motility-associated C-terminal domain-containing protein [Flavobacteriales bacterium]|nr:gliding motility-associated C-terminal domain-containing protein [Flavobacteriales bacterium]
MELRNMALPIAMGLGLASAAQPLPQFNMSDTTVTDCKGILLDSEAGPGGTIYGNNEDFTFTIDAGNTITLVFDPVFCTEQGLDLLTFFDGPTTASPQIGPAYSGIVAPPPIIATSGYLTVHFVSDATVAYCGFEAQWTSEVDPPVPPAMSIPTAPGCNSALVAIQFSDPVPCDSITAEAFTLAGPNMPIVFGAIANSCIGGMASSAQLTVAPPFDHNCPYDLTFTIGLADRCDSIWMFTISASTQITTCPLTVNALVDQDTICAGTCVELVAEVQGCAGYSYAWDNGLPTGAGPHTVCPTVTTTYTVVVNEIGIGQTAQSSVTVQVVDPQVVAPSGPICQSAPAFDLVASPPGGWWNGAGIIDSLAGTLDPDTAGPGIHPITYTLPGGCDNTIPIVVDSMDAGPVQAACPGTTPFFVQGASPAAGIWTGPFIQSSGLFDPSTNGSYTVTYSAGACSDSTVINVDNILGPVSLDTVCQSVYPDTIPISPFGGTWYGAGIVDSIYGVFDPDEAGGGTHILTYAMMGCSGQFPIVVLPADIGGNRSSCPAQAPFVLTPSPIPSGGVWNGLGITDPVTGVYDPFLAGGGSNVNDMLTYAAPNGCVDTVLMYVRWTAVTNDTLFFCSGDAPMPLDNAHTGRTPGGGAWSGSGTYLNIDNNPFYDPGAAGVGVHLLTYLANTCSDTLVTIVHPDVLIGLDTTLCTLDAPYQLISLPPGSIFTGPGITGSTMALFDPAVAGVGVHLIDYSSAAGCSDQVTITIDPFEQAMIGGVQSFYCSNDVQVDVELSPPGGSFSGLPSTTFDPLQLPDGTHTLIYTIGQGACLSSDTLTFIDHPPLTTTFTVSQNPICDGGGSVLEVVPSGGYPGAQTVYQWNNGLFPVSTHTVSPATTTTYIVQTTDGCSDPVIDSVTVGVFPPFSPEFTMSTIACYGTPGMIQASVPGPGTFTYDWSGSTSQSGPVFTGTAGQTVFVTVTEDQSGCHTDSLLQIPSWPPVTALFSVNPDVDCVPFDQGDVTFIDQSNNADSGYWDINGTIEPYVQGDYPHYALGAAGTYTVTLIVYNEGGCVDSLSRDVCILDATPVFVPDIFSPNADGMNDVLFVRGPAIAQLDLAIYDRWGEQVFRTGDVTVGWDGKFRGARMPSGVYVYMGKATLKDGSVVDLSGDVTLVR